MKLAVLFTVLLASSVLYFYITPDVLQPGVTYVDNFIIPPGETAYVSFDTANVVSDNLQEIFIDMRAIGQSDRPTVSLGLTVTEFRPPGLLHWWKFDDGSGTTALDSIGQLNGTIYGAYWTEGKTNTALHFDGVDDYVQISQNSIPSLDQLSFAMWVKLDELTTTYSVFARAWTMDYPGETIFSIFSDGSLLWSIKTSSMRSNLFSEPGMITAGEWYYLVLTYDGSVQKIYINGSEVASISCSGSFSFRSQSLFLGRNGRVPNWFKGTIDEFQIYSRALNPDEVYNLYVGGVEEPVTIIGTPETQKWDVNIKVRMFGPNFPQQIEKIKSTPGAILYLRNMSQEETEKILASPVLGLKNPSLYPIEIYNLSIRVKGVD